ncbi:unnamed protein product [Lymnaea stagnalis]|uniref:Serpin domain-containing protein n=1 Tax=Lymnaea stagnalis TaxID=6523 RepID=A0AAV2HTX3_LYMST
MEIANNTFALELFKLLYETNKEKNSFLSPLIISASATMILMGSRSNTSKSISRALLWETADCEKIHSQFKDYLSLLQEPCQHYEILLGIRLLLEKKWRFTEEFKHKMKEYYLSNPGETDFEHNSDTAREKINSWVGAITHGSVNEHFTPETWTNVASLLLVSSVYFKGKWDHEFDEKNTQELPFVTAPGTSETVPMMCHTGRYPYIKDNELRFSATEIPYQGGKLGMVIILPDEYFGLEGLIRNLTQDNMTSLLRNLYMADSAVNLIVPKFEIKASFNLSQALSKLGMADAFGSDTANFGDMADKAKGVHLSSVDHVAVIKVDEEGTRPAPVTGNRGRAKAGSSNILKVRVDHPFLFTIVDRRIQDGFLFMGHVCNPAL